MQESWTLYDIIPNELLMIILNYFDWNELKELRRVSKFFQAAIESIEYQTLYKSNTFHKTPKEEEKLKRDILFFKNTLPKNTSSFTAYFLMRNPNKTQRYQTHIKNEKIRKKREEEIKRAIEKMRYEAENDENTYIVRYFPAEYRRKKKNFCKPKYIACGISTATICLVAFIFIILSASISPTLDFDIMSRILLSLFALFVFSVGAACFYLRYKKPINRILFYRPPEKPQEASDVDTLEKGEISQDKEEKKFSIEEIEKIEEKAPLFKLETLRRFYGGGNIN